MGYSPPDGRCFLRRSVDAVLSFAPLLAFAEPTRMCPAEILRRASARRVEAPCRMLHSEVDSCSGAGSPDATDGRSRVNGAER
jgi:hypothetical protein